MSNKICPEEKFMSPSQVQAAERRKEEAMKVEAEEREKKRAKEVEILNNRINFEAKQREMEKQKKEKEKGPRKRR